MYKIIIFDFDGTMANTIDEGVKIYNDLAKKYNFLEIKSIDEIKNVSVDEFIKNHKILRIKFPFYYKKFLKLLSSKMGNVKIYDGIYEVIRKLNKNYKLGIVSANSKENIKKFLKQNDLEFYFDFIYNYNFLFGKSRTFKKILKTKKLKKNEIIYIGDEVKDIDAAKKAGIKIISVTWGFNRREALEKKKPDFIADKSKDIIKFLNK